MPILGKKTMSVDPVMEKRQKKKKQAKTEVCWWKADPHTMWQDVIQVGERIFTNMSARNRQHYLYAMAYNDVDLDLYSSNTAGIVNQPSDAGYLLSSRVSVNVIQNAIDTASSIIAKNRPKPLFITDGAKDYDTYLKAELLTQYVQGVIDDIKLYSIAERVFTDGGIYGTGMPKFIPDHELGKIRCEWTPVPEIGIDELDGLREKPSQLHQRFVEKKDRLFHLYPDFEEEINCASSEQNASISQRTVIETVQVWEAWHLPSGKDADDGMHCICINGATLFHEPWERDYYPLPVWRWMHHTHGFWGRGIAKEGYSLQRALDRVYATIDQSQELMAVPLIVYPKTAMIPEESLFSNEIGRGIPYLGDIPPQFMTPPAVSGELYQWAQVLEQKFYNSIGLSQAMAQGQKPPEVKSAVAIEATTDLATGRFQVVGQRWEDWFTEMARIIVDLSKELYDRNPDLGIIYTDKKTGNLTHIPWKEVDMEADRFKISCFEISALPTDPQGRLDMITQWGAQGWIPKEIMMSLLNIPDLRRFSNLETSTSDLVQATIGKIKKDKKYDTVTMAPIPQMNLPFALSIGTQEIVLARYQGCPDEVLFEIQRYLEDMNFELKKQQPPQAPPTPPLGANVPNVQAPTPMPAMTGNMPVPTLPPTQG